DDQVLVRSVQLSSPAPDALVREAKAFVQADRASIRAEHFELDSLDLFCARVANRTFGQCPPESLPPILRQKAHPQHPGMFQSGPAVSIDVAPPDDDVFGSDGEYLNTIVLNDAQNERRDRVRGRRFEQKQIHALASHPVEGNSKRG